MKWTIEYYSKKIEQTIFKLPKTFLARYLRMTDIMQDYGPDLGMPHTRSMKERLFELRLKGKEGIVRVFYCTVVNKRIVMPHHFVKKQDKTPPKELKTARQRLKEVLQDG